MPRTETRSRARMSSGSFSPINVSRGHITGLAEGQDQPLTDRRGQLVGQGLIDPDRGEQLPIGTIEGDRLGVEHRGKPLIDPVNRHARGATSGVVHRTAGDQNRRSRLRDRVVRGEPLGQARIEEAIDDQRRVDPAEPIKG